MSVENLITHPPRTPLVAASILSASFAEMGAQCAAALEGGADLLHLDVMDGHFVPNLTMGPDMARGLREAIPTVTLDAHLMVSRPLDFVTAFAEAATNHLTIHIEAVDDAPAAAEAIHAAGMTAGLALNPPTSADAVLPFVECFDLFLVMSVNPGFAGQKFIPDVLEKVKAISPRLGPHQRLQMDGGVNPQTSIACREAGCDVLVAASAIFGTADYGQAITELRGGASVAGCSN